MQMKITFVGTVWQYPGPGGWFFVTLPEKSRKIVRDSTAGDARPWGAVPVVAAVGASEWSTSLFPDRKIGSYLLPIKAVVRKLEGVRKGGRIQVTLEWKGASKNRRAIKRKRHANRAASARG